MSLAFNTICKCNQPFSDYKKFRDHASECSYIKWVSCDISECTANFFLNVDLYRHKYNDHDQKLICLTCGQEFGKSFALTQHIKSKHRVIDIDQDRVVSTSFLPTKIEPPVRVSKEPPVNQREEPLRSEQPEEITEIIDRGHDGPVRQAPSIRDQNNVLGHGFLLDYYPRQIVLAKRFGSHFWPAEVTEVYAEELWVRFLPLTNSDNPKFVIRSITDLRSYRKEELTKCVEEISKDFLQAVEAVKAARQ